MVTCETSESTSSPSIGIILTLIACLCYSFGNCLQRYSLLRKEDEKVFFILHRNAGWFLGACIYFSANGIYAIALSYAPVTVLAAVFSLTIVTNSMCSVVLLKDSVPLMAYPGYILVLLGAILFAVAVQAEVCHFDGGELIQVMTTTSALSFWLVMIVAMIGGMIFVRWFEKKYPLKTDIDKTEMKVTATPENEANLDASKTIGKEIATREEKITNINEQVHNEENEQVHDEEQPSTQSENTNEISDTNNVVTKDDEDEIDPKLLLVARLVYPLTLGTTEAVGALILKATNSLLTTIAVADDEESNSIENPASDIVQEESQNIGLWIVLIGLGTIIFLGIVMWLRLTYKRFEISGAFPVEFGMLTFGSVVGGFAVFQDYNFVTGKRTWAMVGIGIVSIVAGLVIVAVASWRATLNQKDKQG